MPTKKTIAGVACLILCVAIAARVWLPMVEYGFDLDSLAFGLLGAAALAATGVNLLRSHATA